MTRQARIIGAVIVAGIWINASEFFRNEVLLKRYWLDHYRSLGMAFPSDPQNGMMWVAWGFLFASAICWISRRFGLIQTTLISWVIAFVMMWMVIWNLNVLPIGILPWALPLSLVEVFVASLVCAKLAPHEQSARVSAEQAPEKGRS